MLRLLTTLSLLLFIGFTLAIAALRWIGQQQDQSHFPLPDANGCWEHICLSEPDTKEGVIAVLGENPRISSITAPDQTVLGYHQINFIYIGVYPQVVRLLWLPDYNYKLMRVSTDASNPPLMTLGDVLADLGTPDRVDSQGTHQSYLEYFEYGLIIAVQHRDFGPYGMRIRPNDPVTSLWQFPLDAEFALYPTAWEWHGFGLYLH
jgi:hypothetical protein